MLRKLESGNNHFTYIKPILEENLEIFMETERILEARVLINKCILTYGLTHLAKKPRWLLGERN